MLSNCDISGPVHSKRPPIKVLKYSTLTGLGKGISLLTYSSSAIRVSISLDYFPGELIPI